MQHRQQARRAQAEHQNHQADHHGQYRTINEDVCEFLVHRALAGSGIGHLRVGVVRRLHAVVDQHRHAIAQLELPGGHHGVTGLQPAEHGHLVSARQPGGDEALLGHQLGFAVGALAFVLDQKDRRAIRVVGHGRVRQGDVVARLAVGQSYRGEHAGQQLALGVGNAGAHREVARGRVDLRLDRDDLGFEGFAGRRVGSELRLHAHMHQIDLVLRHGEVDVHRIERLQRDHRRARRQILAEVDLPNAQHARERRGDSGLRQHRLLCVDLLGQRLELGLHAGHIGTIGVNHGLADGLHLELRFVSRQSDLRQIELRLQLSDLRLQLRELGALRGVVDLRQHLACAHFLARAEMNGGDHSCDLRTERGLLAGAQITERLDRGLPG